MSTTDAGRDTPTIEESQVLTFTLGDATYCLAIEYVEEIVDGEEITTLPDSEEHVEGVMDLRGRTTTIINPDTILDTDRTALVTDGGSNNHRIIVLDSKAVDTSSPVGWVVSDVHEVKTVTQEVIDTEAVEDTDLLWGLITEDDEFTLWLNPSELVV
ncbi:MULTISPECIES: chemotaxis protein CheW [Haloarcula]|uniref:chemotaxis protein CheW n=1 Tax=Haloarcula TaxID=2237 RepID=UPI0023ECEF20|nr:chemotaxis protein CheW [Halomicroarcula sp. XH51]